MAQPDDIQIAPVERDAYITETSFVDNSFVTEDDIPIVEDFTAVSEGVGYLNMYTSDCDPDTVSAKKAEEIVEIKENTIKRIISARWLLNDYLSSDDRDPQDKFNNLQNFTKDIISFVKILFLLKSSESSPDEVKSKHSTLITNPAADSHDTGNLTDSSPLLGDFQTHEADDIAILQSIRAEVEYYSQQWVELGESSEERKRVFSDPDTDDFSQFSSVSFRSLSYKRNFLWVILAIIVSMVVIVIFIILVLIIIFSVNR
ncbi:hypothetical protein LOD99_910 [Oopsacas minuta]|uniref:Uncharacterized protein n=1 Tax=Oopsacas minuta TaxID=111878 RepID=A0AAV7K1P2_9METZ|nr:hypothetical protein LOD99_910 [Oopsacas minuta]